MARYTDSVLRWLDVLDVEYLEVDGWRERGSSTFTPKGSVNHHTAGARKGVVPSLGTCINGRPDVPGPLCHGLLGRDRVLRLIASGRANHAGKGGTRGMSGNSSCFGLEVEHVGIAAKEPVDWAQIDTAARIHAAWSLAAGYSAEQVVQHWEWTTRKIDFVKGTVDPDWFRREVARYMQLARNGKPTPTPPKDGFLMALTDAQQKRVLDLLEAADLRITALDQRLSRVEAALNTDGNDAGKPPYPPRAIQSLSRLEAAVDDIKGTVADLAVAVTTKP